jgi:hypothetical protein
LRRPSEQLKARVIKALRILGKANVHDIAQELRNSYKTKNLNIKIAQVISWLQDSGLVTEHPRSDGNTILTIYELNLLHRLAEI